MHVDGLPLRYEVAGEGEPVILVHGLSGSARWWARNVGELARRHRVYTVELPGFGWLRRGARRFSLTDAPDWLAAWMRELRLEGATLVGHSMGALICARVAAERPEYVGRLVLVAPAGFGSERSFIGHVLPLLAAVRGAPLAFIRVLVADAVRAGPASLLHAARALVRHDFVEPLRDVRAPTLLVWGERDPLTSPALGELLQALLPQSRLVVLPGAHVPMFERPEAFNRALLEFLEEETP